MIWGSKTSAVILRLLALSINLTPSSRLHHQSKVTRKLTRYSPSSNPTSSSSSRQKFANSNPQHPGPWVQKQKRSPRAPTYPLARRFENQNTGSGQVLIFPSNCWLPQPRCLHQTEDSELLSQMGRMLLRRLLLRGVDLQLLRYSLPEYGERGGLAGWSVGCWVVNGLEWRFYNNLRMRNLSKWILIFFGASPLSPITLVFNLAQRKCPRESTNCKIFICIFRTLDEPPSFTSFFSLLVFQ